MKQSQNKKKNHADHNKGGKCYEEVEKLRKLLKET